MPGRPKRETVDLSQYPDMVVVYLGMRVNTLTGIKTALGFNGEISKAVAAKPEGLLLHEPILYSLRHVGMRQYWRDFDSLEAWTRSDSFRAAHKSAGGNKPLYIGGPQFEGFVTLQEVKPA